MRPLRGRGDLLLLCAAAGSLLLSPTLALLDASPPPAPPDLWDAPEFPDWLSQEEEAAANLPRDWPNGAFINRQAVICDDCVAGEWKGGCRCSRQCECARGSAPQRATFRQKLDEMGRVEKQWRVRAAVGATGGVSSSSQPLAAYVPPGGRQPPANSSDAGYLLDPLRLPRAAWRAQAAVPVATFSEATGRPRPRRRHTQLLAGSGDHSAAELLAAGGGPAALGVGGGGVKLLKPPASTPATVEEGPPAGFIGLEVGGGAAVEAALGGSLASGGDTTSHRIRLPSTRDVPGEAIGQCACGRLRCVCEQECNACREVTPEQVKEESCGAGLSSCPIKTQITTIWRQQFELPASSTGGHWWNSYVSMWNLGRVYAHAPRQPHTLGIRLIARAQREPLLSEKGEAEEVSGDSAGGVLWLTADNGGTGGHDDAVQTCATRLRAPLCRRSQICRGSIDLKAKPGEGAAGDVDGGAAVGEQWVAVLDDASEYSGKLYPDIADVLQVGDGHWPACLMRSELLAQSTDKGQQSNQIDSPSQLCAKGKCAQVACCPAAAPPRGITNFSALTDLRIEALWRRLERIKAAYPPSPEDEKSAERRRMKRTKQRLREGVPAKAPLAPRGFDGGGSVVLSGNRGCAVWIPGPWWYPESWTIEFWVRPTHGRRYETVYRTGRRWDHKLVLKNNAGRYGRWRLEVTSFDRTYYAYGNKATPAGKWVHVAISVRSDRNLWRWGEAMLYLDGEYVGHTWVWPSPRYVLGWSAFGPTWRRPGWWLRYAWWRNWRMRRWYYYWYAWWDWWWCHPWNNRWWAGAVDEVRLWTPRRTHRDIWYNRWRTLHGKAHNDLVGYWKFDQRARHNRWWYNVAGEDIWSMSLPKWVWWWKAWIPGWTNAQFSRLHAPFSAHESDGWEHEYRQMVLGAPPGRAISVGTDDPNDVHGSSVRLPVWYGTEEWTVEMWVNVGAGAEMWSRLWQFGGRRGGVIFFTTSACCGRGFGLWGREGWHDGQWHTVSAHKVWPKYDEWAHVAVTLRKEGSAQVARIYLDGVEVAKGQFTPRIRWLAGWSNWLGRPAHGAGGIVRAWYDEMRLWSYARSGAGVKTAMHRSLLGMEAGLQMYFRFDEKDERVQFDWSEHYRVAYVYGNAEWGSDTPAHLRGRAWLARNDSNECSHECHRHGKCVDWACVCDEGWSGWDCGIRHWRWECGYTGATQLVECTGTEHDIGAALCVVPPIRRWDGVWRQWCAETRRPWHECRSFRRANVRWFQAVLRHIGLWMPTHGRAWGYTWWLIRIVRSAIGQGPADALDGYTIKQLLRYLIPNGVRRGDAGWHVAAVRALLRFKFNDGRARGWWRWYMTSFDDSLEQAVRAHQAAYNIEDASVVKGEVGTLTWASLLSQCKLVPFAGSGSSGSGGGGGGGGGSTTKVCGTDSTSSDSACSSAGADGNDGEPTAAVVSPSPPPSPPSPPQALAPTSEEEVRERREGRPERWWWWREPANAECGFTNKSKNCPPKPVSPGLYGGWPPVERADATRVFATQSAAPRAVGAQWSGPPSPPNSKWADERKLEYLRKHVP